MNLCSARCVTPTGPRVMGDTGHPERQEVYRRFVTVSTMVAGGPTCTGQQDSYVTSNSSGDNPMTDFPALCVFAETDVASPTHDCDQNSARSPACPRSGRRQPMARMASASPHRRRAGDGAARWRSALLLSGAATVVLLGGCGAGGSGPASEPGTGSAAPVASTSKNAEPAMTNEATPTPNRAAQSEVTQTGSAAADSSTTRQAAEAAKLTITVGDHQFSATMADTDTARAFINLLPLTVAMNDVNGNEKAFDLPKALTASPRNPGAIRNGDLMLYGANTVVLFYESFETSYTYTPIGSLDNPAGLSAALGTGDVTVSFVSPRADRSRQL